MKNDQWAEGRGQSAYIQHDGTSFIAVLVSSALQLYRPSAFAADASDPNSISSHEDGGPVDNEASERG